MGVEVTAPDGRVWDVERHWPRRLRWRSIDTGNLSPLDALDFAEFDSVGGFAVSIFVGVILVVLIGAFIVVVLPLLLLLGEAVLVALGVYLVSRRWVVEATTIGPPPGRYAWKIRGWRRSRRVVAQVAEALRRGIEPELPGAEPAPLRL